MSDIYGNEIKRPPPDKYMCSACGTIVELPQREHDGGILPCNGAPIFLLRTDPTRQYRITPPPQSPKPPRQS